MITIRRLMITVAVVAPFLMVFRESTSGSFLAGLMIVLGCIVILSYKLYTLAITRFEACGLILGGWRRVRIALVSSLLALALVSSADLAFLTTY